MSTLKKLQDDFSAYLLTEDDEIINLVMEQGELDKYSRLNIYKNAYNVRLRSCIETDHPMLALYLGDELFEKMVSAYISEYPSKFTSLRYFCDALPHYLKQDEFFKTVPILAEIASFERLMMSAFDAAEADKRASINELQKLEPDNWPTIKLKFHPSASLFEANWNSVESWQALKNEEAPSEAIENTRYWIIWRGTDRLTQFRNIPNEAYIMFNCFKDDYNFADVCELLQEHLPEDKIGPLTVQHLSLWLEMGVIHEICF